MIQKVVLDLVLGFILRQLAHFRDQIDWGKVDEDLQERARAILPGKWFDDTGAAFAHAVVVAVQTVLGQHAILQRVVEAVGQGRFEEALALVKELLATVWVPNVVRSAKDAGVVPKASQLDVVQALDVDPKYPPKPSVEVQQLVAQDKAEKGADQAPDVPPASESSPWNEVAAELDGTPVVEDKRGERRRGRKADAPT